MHVNFKLLWDWNLRFSICSVDDSAIYNCCYTSAKLDLTFIVIVFSRRRNKHPDISSWRAKVQINCPRLQTSSIWQRYNLNPRCQKPMSVFLSHDLRYACVTKEHFNKSYTLTQMPFDCNITMLTQDETASIPNQHNSVKTGPWSFRNSLIRNIVNMVIQHF